MEAQQIFDKVATHLATQGKRAVSQHVDPYNCMYRSPDGGRCALGALIPDDEYDPDMEGQMATQLFDRWRGPPTLMALAPHRALVVALQGAHDRRGDKFWDVQGALAVKYRDAIVPSIKDRLSRIALAFTLSPAILDTLNFPETWA